MKNKRIVVGMILLPLVITTYANLCVVNGTNNCFNIGAGSPCAGSWPCPGNGLNPLTGHSQPETFTPTTTPTKAWAYWKEEDGSLGYQQFPVTCSVSCTHPRHPCPLWKHVTYYGPATCTSPEMNAREDADPCHYDSGG